MSNPTRRGEPRWFIILMFTVGLVWLPFYLIRRKLGKTR